MLDASDGRPRRAGSRSSAPDEPHDPRPDAAGTRPRPARSPWRRPPPRCATPGSTPARVTHLVTVSCSGFYAPGFDVALIKRLGLLAGRGADARRLHGLPRVRSTACGWPARSSAPTRRPASWSAPSSCAACTTSTAGTPRRSSPTPCSPTAPRRWSSSGARRGAAPARARAVPARRVGLDADRRLGGRHVVADRRPRLRDDALGPRPRADLPPPPPLARRLAGAARPRGRGRSARGPSTPAARASSRRSARPPASAATRSRPRYRVLAEYGNMSSPDRPLHPRPAPPRRRPAALRGPRLRPGPGGRGGAAGMNGNSSEDGAD